MYISNQYIFNTYQINVLNRAFLLCLILMQESKNIEGWS